MVELSYPGVYVQEIPSAARPISAASTSRAVFVGDTEMGDANTARLVNSWEEYQRAFGGFAPGKAYVAHSVFQFFNNGGRTCYVLRVVSSTATTAVVNLLNGGSVGVETLGVTAKSAGSWGNRLFLSVFKGTLDPDNEFGIAVRRLQGTDASTILEQPPLEVHDNLSLDPKAERFVETLLKRSSFLVNAKVLSTAPALGPAQHVGKAQASWPTASGSFRLRVNGTTYTAAVAAAGTAGTPFPNRLRTAIDAAIAVASERPTVSFDPATGDQTLTFSIAGTSGSPVPSVEVLPLEIDMNRAASFAARIGFWPGDAKFVSPYAPRLPALTLATGTPDAPLQLARGGDGAATPAPFAATSSVKSALDRITDASLLVLPGLSDEFSNAVSYCENRPLKDMFFIGDAALPTGDVATEISAVKSAAGGQKANGLGAIYFPWVLVRDPTGVSTEPIPLPPSGFVAGIYARTDRDRGVWKAPAGVEASLGGALGLTHYLTDEEQGALNLRGVNVLRKFDAGGIVVWGARTLTTDSSLRYIPVRRVQSMIQRSVYDGLQSAVFQPNNHLLWASLKSDVGAFLNSLFRAGAFQGETARQAYFVRCGLNETMTQTDIDLGMVVVDVGFAPLKPAEFVVVRVQHSVNPS